MSETRITAEGSLLLYDLDCDASTYTNVCVLDWGVHGMTYNTQYTSTAVIRFTAVMTAVHQSPSNTCGLTAVVSEQFAARLLWLFVICMRQ